MFRRNDSNGTCGSLFWGGDYRHNRLMEIGHALSSYHVCLGVMIWLACGEMVCVVRTLSHPGFVNGDSFWYRMMRVAMKIVMICLFWSTTKYVMSNPLKRLKVSFPGEEDGPWFTAKEGRGQLGKLCLTCISQFRYHGSDNDNRLEAGTGFLGSLSMKDW